MRYIKIGERHFIERRNHKRFYFRGHAYAFNSVDFGQIIDISMGGLALVTGDKMAWKNNGTHDLHIIFADEEFFFRGIQTQKSSLPIPHLGTPVVGTTLYRCSLRFVGMPEKEKLRLRQLIKQHTYHAKLQ